MKNLPATSIAFLLTIVCLGPAYADNPEETSYEIQQEHAAPVTVTELPGSDRSAPDVENAPGVENAGVKKAHVLKGAQLDSSQTEAQATSIDDQLQASEAYAERRQQMIEHCEQNNGIDCASEVDTELRAEAIQRHRLVNTMRPASGPR